MEGGGALGNLRILFKFILNHLTKASRGKIQVADLLSLTTDIHTLTLFFSQEVIN